MGGECNRSTYCNLYRRRRRLAGEGRGLEDYELGDIWLEMQGDSFPIGEILIIMILSKTICD